MPWTSERDAREGDLFGFKRNTEAEVWSGL